MNKLIVQQFGLLIQQINAEHLNAQVDGDEAEVKRQFYRKMVMKKILESIKRIDFEITDSSQLIGMSGIGDGTRKRIDEILQNGHLKELDNKYSKTKKSKIDGIMDLTNVIGIGNASARKMVVEHGLRNVQDLIDAVKKGKITVNHNVALGLKYYGIVQGAIPRSEVKDTEAFLKKVARSYDKQLHVMVCGSYRRGKLTSGDIDLLMYHPSLVTHEQIASVEPSYLQSIVDDLSVGDHPFFLDSLTFKNYRIKYMGFCKYLDYPVRRIDIRYVPYENIGAAMLYFTGPYELNTKMRTEAKRRGLVLNEYGLYRIDRKTGQTQIIPTITEKDIFELLDMKYIDPLDREEYNTHKTGIKKK